MRTVETNRDGSFIACGVGIYYKYTARAKTLEIFRQLRRTYLFNLSLEHIERDDVPGLIRKLDKAAQVKALMISNHKTNNITDVIGADKMPALLQSAFKLAFYAHDAKAGNWPAFSLAITNDFALQQFKLKRFICPSAGSAYIRGAIKTFRDNEITVRAKNLEGVFKELSEKVMQDLILAEFAYRQDYQAHQLVSLSSRLAILSRIIDPAYYPKKQLFILRRAPREIQA